jgi:RluA family pseudouridine synthase
MGEWKVEAAESGLTLLVFLRTKLDAPASNKQLKRAIDEGRCLVNGKRERFSSCLVGQGDRVTFEETEKNTRRPAFNLQEHLLYRDADIIAIDKPPGMVSDDPSFLNALKSQYPGITLLHRLDRDTTGVLLFGLNQEAINALLNAFKNRQVKKNYLALVDGVPASSSGVVENYLGKLHSYEGQSLWGAVSKERGVFAYTAWQVLKKGEQAALIGCCPETGRTHQIRVHLAGLGHPILGDYQYGRSFRCSYRPPHMLLHAAEVSFMHPRSKQQVVIAAELPEEFQTALNHLIKGF